MVTPLIKESDRKITRKYSYFRGLLNVAIRILKTGREFERKINEVSNILTDKVNNK